MWHTVTQTGDMILRNYIALPGLPCDEVQVENKSKHIWGFSEFSLLSFSQAAVSTR